MSLSCEASIIFDIPASFSTFLTWLRNSPKILSNSLLKPFHTNLTVKWPITAFFSASESSNKIVATTYVSLSSEIVVRLSWHPYRNRLYPGTPSRLLVIIFHELERVTRIPGILEEHRQFEPTSLSACQNTSQKL